jgi:hypothetical protein
MNEYVKYNCHVMQVNDIGKKTPEIIFQEYLRKRKNGADYFFQNTDCVVTSVTWAQGRTGIITRIVRKDSLKNENICTE